MRIISELIPSGQPIASDIEGARQPGKNVWEIPTWGKPLALGVYPFFVRVGQRLMPAGTAFCISKLGVSVTALRNVREAFPGGGQEKTHGLESPKTRGEDHGVPMAVLHHRATQAGRVYGRVWTFEGIEEVGVTDICYVFPQFQADYPYLPLPLTFKAPRIGSRVICVGFGSPPKSEKGLKMDESEAGRLNLLDIYEHKLVGVEARVTRIFRERFTAGFIEGPCCTIDAEVEHDMNGGAVFTEYGYVCGMLSGKATGFFGKPASIVSLLYPALGSGISFGGSRGGMRISSKHSLADLIAQGSVTTDGSEHVLRTPYAAYDLSLCPGAPIEDEEDVYEDFTDFQKKQGSPPGKPDSSPPAA